MIYQIHLLLINTILIVILKNVTNKTNTKLDKCSYSKKNFLIAKMPTIKKLL